MSNSSSFYVLCQCPKSSLQVMSKSPDFAKVIELSRIKPNFPSCTKVMRFSLSYAKVIDLYPITLTYQNFLKLCKKFQVLATSFKVLRLNTEIMLKL
jgi:hypothetical protein